MTNPSIAKYLSSHYFFSGLNPEFIEFLARCANQRQLKQDEILFRQGERAHQFFLLRKGSISIEIPAITGPMLEVQNLEPDQILGWSWLIAPYQWNFQARAVESSEVLEFDGDAVLARCEEEPKFGYELVKRFSSLMSERLNAARRKMMDQWNPPGFA